MKPYVGPKVVFIDRDPCGESVCQLIADFKSVGIYAEIESSAPSAVECGLILFVLDTVPVCSADIVISTRPLREKHVLYRGDDVEQRKRDFFLIQKELDEWQQKQPLWACILIGGKSSRMGRPKHLLPGYSKKTWLEEKVELLSSLVDGIVFSGKGDIPVSLSEYKRVADAPCVAGPMAGLLGAMDSYPRRSWLVCACDMPLVSRDAVLWLRRQRRFAHKAIVPMRSGVKKGRVGMFAEPLLACYEYSCRGDLESLAKKGVLQISKIAEKERVLCPVIPQELQNFWANINTPEEMAKMKEKG